MALEDAVTRLAAAFETHGRNANAAVAEIIRQRDEWQKEAARLERDRDWYKNYLAKSAEDGRHKDRVISALRGTITRMKKAKAQ